jgi:glycosyltransferase involved in cell wall biosynthesis
VEAQVPSARLLVVGTGAPELLAQVRDQADRLRLERVTLDPRFISVEELVALYQAADVAVYPYRAITTSGALATGLSLGKAILATDLPAFRDLLTDGKDAVLVPPGDSNALAEAILDLYQRPDFRKHLAAETVAKDFGSNAWAQIAEETKAVYRKALAP